MIGDLQVVKEGEGVGVERGTGGEVGIGDLEVWDAGCEASGRENVAAVAEVENVPGGGGAPVGAGGWGRQGGGVGYKLPYRGCCGGDLARTEVDIPVYIVFKD